MANYSHLSKEAFPSSVAVCQKIVEQLTQVDYVRVIVKVTAQWYILYFYKVWTFFHFLYHFSETKYKCINMFGRTEDIIEIQEGNLVDNMDSACSVENMDDDNLPFTTLISKQNIKQFFRVKIQFSIPFQMLKCLQNPAQMEAITTLQNLVWKAKPNFVIEMDSIKFQLGVEMMLWFNFCANVQMKLKIQVMKNYF